MLPRLVSSLLAVALLVVDASAEEAPTLRSEMLVSTQWLAERLDDEEVLIIHVGHGRRGYDKMGHVPGAVFVDMLDLLVRDADVPDELPDRDALIAWCRSVGIDGDRPQRIVLYGDAIGLFPARLYATLATLGLADRVSLLDGHIRRWREEGRPVELDEVTPMPSTWSPAPADSPLVAFDDVRVGLSEHGWSAIDARKPESYRGDRAGHPRVAAAGHIPGATNAPWQDAVLSVHDPALLPPEVLRDQFGSIDPDRPVVAYCATGMRSSMTYFLLRYLGYDARWYDGSLIDWQRRGGPTASPSMVPDEPASDGQAEPR
ncbi:MAG: rhodanese-like domain-containing protein [Planctomycetota bacterium]